LIGDYVTFIDFFFFETINLLRFVTGDDIFTDKPGLYSSEDIPYSKLKDYYFRVRNLPGLGEYYNDEKCPEHLLTFNNPSAKRYI